MQLNEEEKERIEKQLHTMFSGMHATVIRTICEHNEWNFQKCLDHLLGGNKQGSSKTKQFSDRNTDFRKNNINRNHNNYHNSNNNNHNNNNININIQKSNFNMSQTQKFTDKEIEVLRKISQGFKILIIMRGASGSGKSTLAKSIIEYSIPPSKAYTLQDFIISADDYFYNATTGRYTFCRDNLDQAHSSAQNRVAKKAAEGWSPIIVDNTNTQIWEMLPYVERAIENGYIIEILEPRTPWKRSAVRLSEKNSHGVPADRIKLMLNRYEPVTVEALVQMARHKYVSKLPQLRNYPPISVNNSNEPEAATLNVFSKMYLDDRMQNNYSAKGFGEEIKSETLFEESLKAQDEYPKTDAVVGGTSADVSEEWGSYYNDNDGPKEQRHRNSRRSQPIAELERKYEQQSDVDSRPSTSKSVRKNKGEYSQPNSIAAKFDPNTVMRSTYPQSANSNLLPDNSTFITLLRDSSSPQPPQSQREEMKEEKKVIHLDRHTIGCVNENKSFILLRQIYPDKNLNALWDLFTKCGGDANWAADILLKDTMSNDEDSQGFLENDSTKDVFNCNCDSEIVCEEESEEKINLTPYQRLEDSVRKPNLLNDNKQAAQRNQRVPRNNQRCTNTRDKIAKEELKKFVENSFVLPKTASQLERGNAFAARAQTAGQESELDAEPDSDSENEELVQLTLESSTIKQLQTIFGSSVTVTAELPNPTTPTTVFMRRALAKDLYMVCVEAMYNQVEEERQKTVREDEAFAKLLKNPNYQHYTESPGNTQELLDMEMAWRLLTNEEEDARDQEPPNEVEAVQERPKDLAFYITISNLSESFPDIPRETLSDILIAHNHNYAETVQVLRSTMCTGVENETEKFLTPEELQEESMRVKQLLEYINGRNLNNLNIGNLQSAYISSKRLAITKSPLPPEEAKRIALRDFEETRNMAVHHCQLKAECYQKAKSAIQSGNGAVAFYYSEIANLHKKKIDMFNHRAANCIMDVHKHSQNNPDLLDLHYLHTVEALASLDLFVDRHIISLKNLQRVYKHVFIITGRGLHSHGGISTIKNKVRARLNERGLRWNEVNPGLLKVKVFSASRIGADV